MAKETMPDVQNTFDDRGISIERVGVTGFKCPIVVLDRFDGVQHVTAEIEMSVDLPQQFKGTHMSRFVEVLNNHRGELTMRTLPSVLGELRERLEAASARIDVRFLYFLDREAPVSKLTALMDYACGFTAESNGAVDDFLLSVVVPVASLCPCSKEISDYGAHNQRGHVTVEVRSRRDDQGVPETIWIEELVALTEKSASAPLYPLLKRPDERYVTMQAYDNPAFVEDLVRNVAVRLKQDQRVDWFRVHALNFESIHNHNAFARVTWQRPTDSR